MSKDCEGPMGQAVFLKIVQIFRRFAQVTSRPQRRFSETINKILNKTSLYKTKTIPVSLDLRKLQNIDYVTKSHW
jgi:hypothetical protein